MSAAAPTAVATAAAGFGAPLTAPSVSGGPGGAKWREQAPRHYPITVAFNANLLFEAGDLGVTAVAAAFMTINAARISCGVPPGTPLSRCDEDAVMTSSRRVEEEEVRNRNRNRNEWGTCSRMRTGKSSG